MWFWLRRLFGFSLGFGAGFVLPWLVYLDQVIQARFDLSTPAIPSRVYARPLVLQPGELSLAALRAELLLLRYVSDAKAGAPGSFSQAGASFIVNVRSFAFEDGVQRARRVLLRFDDARLAALKDADSSAVLANWRLDPVKIATLFSDGKNAAERQPMAIEQMPTLLVAGLQAVEDRNFKSHHGVDPLGLLRAIWANLRGGGLHQGGSTLTQQLVKNTLLTPAQTLERKLKEMGLALLLERRFDKKTILEAYLNRVVLGQSGDQPIQGFPAASEFYFGRNLEELKPQDIAMLVGLLKATSSYDPRRNPENATRRRAIVLSQFLETGLIDAATFDSAKVAPLNVIAKAVAARERYPAFVALVRAQIARNYDAQALTSQGLSVLTTLDAQAQERAEAALVASLNAIDPNNSRGGGALQGALVLTENATGEIVAMVGSRDPRSSNFNHAIDARRPVGSLLKPFVYLLALSDPAHYALGSTISDAPIDVKLSGNQRWRPQNYDHLSHGNVLLIDALAKSYNLAAARVGLDIGVDRLAELIRTLGVDVPVPAPPAMILGAVDLSPMQVAQLYQALASGGRVLPLVAVRAVMDRSGKALNRFPRLSIKPPNSEAIKLVNLALNETTRTGTAQSLVNQVKLDVAGKTGTSNDKRDSWYAGYTGKHLGVVWMGRDDNESTNLTGATGALRAWTALFKTLPSTPLHIQFAPSTRWLPVDANPDCAHFRFLPTLAATPANLNNCMGILTAP
jgi:penicillin-binding protein 1B